MRIVLIGPSHWHYPMYRDGIRRSKVDVVGVMDTSTVWSEKIAHEWNCKSWTDLNEMLELTRPDFAFAFGVHAAMPSIANALVSQRIPFSIEKPGGLKQKDVSEIRKRVEDAGLFVSVPFHYRLSGLNTSMRQIATLPSSDFLRWDFRINAGSPLRFQDSSPWLVEPELAGGGCMMNLAHHPIDFLLGAMGVPVETVSATASNQFLGLQVEDTSVLELKFTNSTTATITTGYTHSVSTNSYMEFDVTVDHRDFSAKRCGEQLLVRKKNSWTEAPLQTDWNFKRYFADYAANTIERVINGTEPLAKLRDLEATVEIVEAGYKSIRTGRPVVIDINQKPSEQKEFK